MTQMSQMGPLESVREVENEKSPLDFFFEYIKYTLKNPGH